MAFKECNTGGKYDTVISKAGAFLKGLQQDGDDADPKHGGFGYDATSRPDLSNTAFSVEALLAAGTEGPLPLVVRRDRERVVMTLEATAPPAQ